MQAAHGFGRAVFFTGDAGSSGERSLLQHLGVPAAGRTGEIHGLLLSLVFGRQGAGGDFLAGKTEALVHDGLGFAAAEKPFQGAQK
jgi:hypothetical protein